MQEEQVLQFGSYRLTGPHGPLIYRSHSVNLPPKALATLWVLASQAGKVVTKEALLSAVWPETVVSEGVLSACVRTLRRALRDDATRPRYIETAHKLGYRFIEKVISREEENQKSKGKNRISSPNPQPPTPVLVGREAELVQLRHLLERALRGERQMVFVTGEAGIGKTTLVETFLRGLASSTQHHKERQKAKIENPAPSTQHPIPSLWLGQGQCIEHYGAGEAYLPVLEALGRLGRQSDGERFIEVLSQHAPSWSVQLPTLFSPVALEALQYRIQGATRERMLREMAEALEVMTAERPMLLVLEDLHWSDASTLELLAAVARRQEAARLLIVGTYRPVELIVHNHPLKAVKQELAAHGQCAEVALGYLSPEAVHAYVDQRFVDQSGNKDLAAFVYRRTEGQPLFMVQVADYVEQQGLLLATPQAEAKGVKETAVEQTVPQGLQQLIEAQLGLLDIEEQRVLEVGSVAGAEFVVASVAAGVKMAAEAIEEVCEGLVQRGQFIEERELATWPDGTVSGRYGFRHALYQEVVYKRIGTERRARLHRLIGAREEAGYKERTGEIAAALALHFERGRDSDRAIQYHQQAGENALRRNAYQEAAVHCTTGLTLLPLLPDTSERARHELSLQMTLAVVLAATKGYAAPEVEHAYLRARALCEQTDDAAQLVRVLRGLMILYTVRANFPAARGLGEHFLTLAQQAHDPSFLELTHMLLGVVLLWLGELTAAGEHFAQGVAFHDPHQDLQQRRSQAVRNGQDHQIALLSHAAWMLWLQGYADQALQRSQEALRLADELAHPFSSAFALIYAAGVHQFRREEQAAQQLAEATIARSTEQGFQFLSARGMSVRGWTFIEQGQIEEGIAQLRQALTVYQALGIERGQPHFLAVLAEAHRKAEQSDEGLALVARAQDILTISGERWWEAELYRLKGELVLQSGVRGPESEEENQKSKGKRRKSKIPSTQSLTPSTQEAEACFLKAIEIARRQGAKSLELRATTSLSQLWQQQGKEVEAHGLLVEIYGWFTEGFETRDLQEAQALLAELTGDKITTLSVHREP